MYEYGHLVNCYIKSIIYKTITLPKNGQNEPRIV